MPGSEGGAAPVFVFRSLLLATSLEVGRETAQRRKPGLSPTGGTDGTASSAWRGLGHHLGDSTQRPGPGQASGLGEQTDFDLLPLAAKASKAEQPGEGGWREAEGPRAGRRGGLTPSTGEPAYPPPTPRFPVKRQTTWTNQLPNRFPTGILVDTALGTERESRRGAGCMPPAPTQAPRCATSPWPSTFCSSVFTRARGAELTPCQSPWAETPTT